MKIKRYTAPSMRAALAQVRAEQGPDAVILSSRRSEEGIEIIAAIDYDQALFAEAKRQGAALAAPQATQEPLKSAPVMASPAPAAKVAPQALAPVAARPERVKAASVAPAPKIAPVRPVAPQVQANSVQKAPEPGRPDFAYILMQREMRQMRLLMEQGMAHMGWAQKRMREPLKAQVLEKLSTLDIAPDVAKSIAEATPQATSLEDPSHIPLALLFKRLPLIDDQSSAIGGVTALVGPTGAGKTTTMAKLAARWCMKHGNADIALISTDAYRIGAREQLLTYARILDVPMHTANTGKELARLLERLANKQFVLIDTAGMGPRDSRLAEQMAALRLGAPKAKILLTLPAQAESQALDDIVKAYASVKPGACVITKVDEAASLGAVLSAVIRHNLKIAYVCDGQRVPEDLHASQQRRTWLVRAALELKEGAAHAPDEAYFARHFGKVAAHA